MGDYWTNPVRHPEDMGVGHIKRTVNFDTLQTGTLGVPIGALEAGAIPLHCHVTVITAFNGGTNDLRVGTDDDDDGFATTAGAAPATIGFKDNLKGALSGIPLATNEVVYAKFAQTGAPATAGKAEVILTFVNKRELVGIPFPNN